MLRAMAEHIPPPILLRALELLFWAMAVAALMFWAAAVIWPGGLRGLVEALGAVQVTLFTTAHIPTAIIGVLLWQWQRHHMAPQKRVLLEAATLYFGLAVLFSIFMNYLAATILDDIL